MTSDQTRATVGLPAPGRACSVTAVQTVVPLETYHVALFYVEPTKSKGGDTELQPFVQ